MVAKGRKKGRQSVADKLRERIQELEALYSRLVGERGVMTESRDGWKNRATDAEQVCSALRRENETLTSKVSSLQGELLTSRLQVARNEGALGVAQDHCGNLLEAIKELLPASA